MPLKKETSPSFVPTVTIPSARQCGKLRKLSHDTGPIHEKEHTASKVTHIWLHGL